MSQDIEEYILVFETPTTKWEIVSLFEISFNLPVNKDKRSNLHSPIVHIGENMKFYLATKRQEQF